MEQTRFEEAAIENAYSVGEISQEEYHKLMSDLTPLLWEALHNETIWYSYQR